MMNVLRNREFARLVSAHTVSQLGTGVTELALPLIAAVTLSAPAAQVGLLQAAETVPILVLGLLAGVWVDRRQRKPLMVASDLGRFALLLLIPLAAWRGWLSMPLLLGIMVAAGSLTVLFDIASQSFTAELLDGDDLVGGNSLLQSSYAVGAIAGPGLAGLLIGAFQAPFAVLLDACSFLISAVMIGSIRSPEPAATTNAVSPRSIRAELSEGLGVVWRSPILRTLGLSTGVWNLFENARNAMLVLYLSRTLGASPAMIGLTYSAGAAGWLAGSLFSGPAARRFGLDRAIVIGALLVLPADVIVAVAGGTPAVAAFTVGVGFFLSGLFGPVYDVNQFSLRQAMTPLRLQGRVGGVLRVIIRGTHPIGALLGGLLAGVIGLRGVAWLAVLGPIFAALLVWFSPVRGMREMPARDTEN
ncbi:MAG: MFS transporter [Thermomicrobiales bacterium]